MSQESKVATQAKFSIIQLKENSVFFGGAFLFLVITGILIAYSNPFAHSFGDFAELFGGDFVFYMAVGFGAQMIDGALGMAYGVTSNSLLFSLGVPPAISSASIHVAEMFTTGASALSHYKFKNINKKLFRQLLIPGAIGAVLGAYLLSDHIDGDFIKPYMALYMAVLGVLIIKKGFASSIRKKKTKRVGLLAAFGGFMDSVGGGGWGPIVASTLLGQGRNPRYTIGSVNAAEFGITFASGITFLIFTGVNSWQVVLGLIVGGVIAAPFGAILVQKIKRRPLMIAVGVLVILISLYNIYKIWFV